MRKAHKSLIGKGRVSYLFKFSYTCRNKRYDTNSSGEDDSYV